MALLILTSRNQTMGAVQNIASSTTSTSLNPGSITAMAQAATDLTAAGSNLLKLNQQSMSATQGLLPNSTLTVDPALSIAKTGLDSLFSAQGATATATDFFRAAKQTAAKITNDIKSVTEKLVSGVNTGSTISRTNLASLTNIMSTTSAAAATGGRYIPAAGTILGQTGSINSSASAAVQNTVGALQQSGINAGISSAQIAAANPAATAAVGALSQATKISVAGMDIPNIDPLQLKSATAAIEAAQNPPNPLATTGAKIGAVDRSKLDAAFLGALPPGLPSFDPGTVSAAKQAESALNTARFKSVNNQNLVYSGQDPAVWDQINQERLRRGLSGLNSPRPATSSDYVIKYSSTAYNSGG